jgi:hypothetical protein
MRTPLLAKPRPALVFASRRHPLRPRTVPGNVLIIFLVQGRRESIQTQAVAGGVVGQRSSPPTRNSWPEPHAQTV